MKQNFRYITKFEEETRAERLEKRMVNTLAVYLPTNQAYFFFMGDEKKSPSTWTRIFVNQSTKDVLSTKQDLEEWAKSEGKDLTKIRKGLYVVDPDYNANSSSAQLETRAIGTIDGILNASKLLLTASKKLLRYCDKENNPFVEKLTQFIQTLEAHIQMASRVEKLGLKELSLQYGMDSDNIVSLVGQFYFVDYRKQGVTQREFEGLMDDVIAKGDEVDSLANLADRSSSARLETRSTKS